MKTKLELYSNPELYREYSRKIKLDTLFTVSALLLSPLIALFVKPDWNLPKWLKWVQTVDSTMNGGGWAGDRSLGGGDGGFYRKWMGWYSKKPSYWRRVVIAFMWQWRNPAQGFSYHVMGKSLPEEWYVWEHPESTRSWEKTGTHNDTEGWWYVELRDSKTDKPIMFQFYEVQFYEKSGNRYGHRQNYGWKLNAIDKPLWGGRCMIVSSNNMIRKFD